MNNLYYNPKKLRQIKDRRRCRSKRIGGWILTAIGGLSILDGITDLIGNGALSDAFDGLIFLIPGLFLLLHAKRQVSRWDRYEALIDGRGNTSIRMLCEKMKLPEKTVHADLYRMISNDFFIGPNYNIEAYIDGERDMLVMAVGGRPLKPLPEMASAEAEQEPQRQQQTSDYARDDDGKDDRPEKETDIRVELTDLEMIRKVITETSDDEVRNSLYGIEGSLRRIDDRIHVEPGLMKKASIRKLYKYYVPQIMELIRAYRDKDTSVEMRRQIGEALHTSAGALASIEAGLLEKEQMDLEVNIQVLRNMFARDGLLKSGIHAKARADGEAAGSEAEAEAQKETAGTF